MTKREFASILPWLKLYKDCCKNDEIIESWFDSLKEYDFIDVDTAFREYSNSSSYTPRPLDIINLIPKADPKTEFKQLYDSNGVKLIQCRRCRDTGLITWEDHEGRRYGKPCDCPSGRKNYNFNI